MVLLDTSKGKNMLNLEFLQDVNNATSIDDKVAFIASEAFQMIEGGEIVLYDLRDELREDPKRPGNSELILGVALKIEYNPTSDFSL